MQTADVWLKRGTNAASLTDMANTNAQFSYSGNNAKAVANVKWFVPVNCTTTPTVACDLYQINWLSDAANSIQLAAFTQGSRTGPSAMVTVTLIGPLSGTRTMPTRRLLSAHPNLVVAQPEVRWMDMSEYLAKATALTQHDATS
jgi:hypothetical protein